MPTLLQPLVAHELSVKVFDFEAGIVDSCSSMLILGNKQTVMVGVFLDISANALATSKSA